ncbi:flavodoxin domain-containing protein [Sporolactobacillus sp. CQH2019]|uniref:flavodoxin domain-containing protein n=1 Tax=Sporolactobacillus sp. CQH2019 TaxID=3023512 RepID=UPI0023688846|nr:flavodoxin domain-containing protein [Sporolactobacillus sp. CQH2019]MDD9149617.1 flavodoxin domain-containing protein [Sporolactobacillus sp. CQH2019]
METLPIFYSTQTGHNLELALWFVNQFRNAGVDTMTVNMATANPILLTKVPTALIITGTYGMGELAFEALPFVEKLRQLSLTHLQCGVTGIGDRYYHNDFCKAVDVVAKAVTTAGASLLTPPLKIDLEFTADDWQRLNQLAIQLIQIVQAV